VVLDAREQLSSNTSTPRTLHALTDGHSGATTTAPPPPAAPEPLVRRPQRGPIPSFAQPPDDILQETARLKKIEDARRPAVRQDSFRERPAFTPSAEKSPIINQNGIGKSNGTSAIFNESTQSSSSKPSRQALGDKTTPSPKPKVEEPAAVPILKPTPIPAAERPSPPLKALPLRPPIVEPSFSQPRPLLPGLTSGNASAFKPPTQSRPQGVETVDRVPRNPPAPVQTQVDGPAAPAPAKPKPKEVVEVVKEEPKPNPVAVAKREAGAELPTIRPSKRLTILSNQIPWDAPLPTGISMMVNPSHAKSPMELWIQTHHQVKTCQQITIEIFDNIRECKEHPISFWKAGDLCLAPFGEDYYRGEIVKNNPNEDDCIVFFLDFGNDERIRKDKIYAMPRYFLRFPRQVYHCQWDIGPTGEMNEEQMKEIYDQHNLEIIALEELQPGQYAIAIGSYRPKQKVIITKEYASKPPRETPMFLAKNFKYSPNLKTNTELGIMFTYTLTRYVIGSSRDDDSREEMHKRLNNDMKDKLKPYDRTPIIGEIVIGKYEDELYRAIVADISGEMLSLEFIDYGDVTKCKAKEVYFAPEAIMKYPRFGMNVHLDTSRIKNLVTVVPPEVENQLYRLMTVEFTGKNADRPDETNVVFWIDEERTLNELFEDKSKLEQVEWQAD
jgi:hypothetical protein